MTPLDRVHRWLSRALLVEFALFLTFCGFKQMGLASFVLVVFVLTLVLMAIADFIEM